MAKKPDLEQKLGGVKLSNEDQQIILKLQAKLGLNFSSLVRLSLRKLAEAEGLGLKQAS